MAEVTLVHPVTGATRTVSSQKAVHLKENGWVSNQRRVSKKAEKPDAPDVERGRRLLKAETGEIPAEAVKKTGDKPLATQTAAADNPSSVKSEG